MDANGFDTLTRSLLDTRSRRGALAALFGGALGLLEHTQARARKRKRKKKPCPPCRKRRKGTCRGKLPDGVACPGGTCRAGTCVASSCAEACAAGCCDASGACQPGDAADACGAAGRACRNCAAQGQVCVSGQCQPQTCFSDTCQECQWCNATVTGCEADPAAVGQPCFSVTCESGFVGVCESGQCQCKLKETCVDSSCDDCWHCNDTRSACVINESMRDTPCTSVTCEGGGASLCVNGQCTCQ